MHDLIQYMGWKIVRQESKDPGRRSRLRDAEEVYDVLKNNRGTDLVEGMLLDVSQIGEVAFNVDSLKKMPNLRLLKFYSPLPVEVPMRRRYFVSEGTHLVDGLQNLYTIIKMHVERLIKLNLPMHVEHTVLSLPIGQDSVKVKGSVLDIPNQFVKHQMLSNLPGISKLLNYNECDEVLILETNNVSGSKQLVPLPDLNIGSALKGLTDLGGEVHIKSLRYIFMDGCSILKNCSVLKKKRRPLHSTDTGMGTFNLSTGLLSNLEEPKESSVLPKEMRQLNLADGGMELLNSSMGNFSALECSEIDGLQLDTLPNELPLLRSTHYHSLSTCREQGTRRPKLLVLFDGLRYSECISFLVLRGLSFHLDYYVTLRELFGINDAIYFQWLQNFLVEGLTNSLEALILDGCYVVSLPRAIKHLSRLKKLSMRCCRFLQSIPELPPSIQTLDAYNCVLLETVAFSSNAAGGSLKLEQMDISFQNCTSLDRKKFDPSFHQYAKALAHGYKLRRENSCISHFSVCYPATKVPEWFTYCSSGASITVELASPSTSKDPFPLSCLLCIVLSPSNYPFTVHVECQSYCEDGNMPRYATKKCVLHEFWEYLNLYHVCMWYMDSNLLREIKEAIVNDQCTSSSYDLKVTFQFSFEVEAHSNMPKQELYGLIKECGVCPLYLGDDLNFIKTKRHWDVFDLETTGIGIGVGSCGDQEPLPPAKKLKGLV